MPKISETICYNCFRERPDSQENPSGKGPCPYCGFDLEENAKNIPSLCGLERY